MLPADLVALRDPVHGDLLLDIPTILAHVATIHGNVSAEDLLVWKAALLEKLSSPTDFLKQSVLVLNMLRLRYFMLLLNHVHHDNMT